MKKFWYTYFSNKPWANIVKKHGRTVILDYNEAFIDSIREGLEDKGFGKTDDELLELYINPHPKPEPEIIVPASTEPEVEIGYENGKLVVKSYNTYFVEDQRKKMGDLALDLSDEDVVKLFIDKENLEREEPLLTLYHHGVEQDGKVKVTIEWNQAFIKHLNDLGIFGEDDRDMVNLYLEMVSPAAPPVEREPSFNREEMEAAFAEMTAEDEQELKDAEKEGKTRRRRTKRSKQQ